MWNCNLWQNSHHVLVIKVVVLSKIVARSAWITSSAPATGTNDPARIWANIFASKQNLFFQCFAVQARLLFKHYGCEARPLLKHSLDAKQDFGILWCDVCGGSMRSGVCWYVHTYDVIGWNFGGGDPLHIHMYGKKKNLKERKTWQNACLVFEQKCGFSLKQAFLHVQNVWTKPIFHTPNVWTKTLVRTQNVWTKVMFCIQNICASLASQPSCFNKIFCHIQNVWAKVLLGLQNVWKITLVSVSNSKCSNKSLLALSYHTIYIYDMLRNWDGYKSQIYCIFCWFKNCEYPMLCEYVANETICIRHTLWNWDQYNFIGPSNIGCFHVILPSNELCS